MPKHAKRRVALNEESPAIQWPIPNDWQPYQRPTLFRRAGCGFNPLSPLHRAAMTNPTNLTHMTHMTLTHTITLPKVLPVVTSELDALVIRYGGVCQPIAKQTLLVFPDDDRALRCQRLLAKRGVTSLRCDACLVLPVLSS